ncbi:hypothetical protein JCM8097_008904 [Rhodosporidiobolus ruineniae]
MDTQTTPDLPSTTHALARLNHPHYHLNSLLCLPFPILLLLNTQASSALSVALIATPLLIALSTAARSSSDNLEFLHETTTFQLRLFNLFGLFFTRNQFGLGKRWVFGYFVVWQLVSFFFPQPSYLGPSNLKELTTDEFDAQILLLPPAQTAASIFASAGLSEDLSTSESGRIVELDSDDAAPLVDPQQKVELGDPKAWNLVLFHVDWSKKSRELEMTLARLSALYSSPSLRFSLLTPSAAPGTFYDLELSTSPTSTDLPLLRLYRGGKVVKQAPRGAEEVKAERKAAKQAGREEKQAGRRSKGKRRKEEEESGSESGSDTDSEDEREVAQEVARGRYRWDRSAAAIVREFRLEEISGVRVGREEERKRQ